MKNRNRLQLSATDEPRPTNLKSERSPSLLSKYFSKPKSSITIALHLCTPPAIIFSGLGYFDIRRSLIGAELSRIEIILSAVLIGVLITSAFVALGGYFNRRKHSRLRDLARQ